MPDDTTTANARYPVLGANLLQADPSRQVQDQNLCYAIKRKQMLQHYLGFRWIVGHKLHTDRTVVERFWFLGIIEVGNGLVRSPEMKCPMARKAASKT
jgi:hypothetical protein